MVSSKPGGILRPPAGSRSSPGVGGEDISLSNQVPTGMNAALPSRNACCDWRCERPSEPGRTYPLVTISSMRVTTCLTASVFQAPSSRLSIALPCSGPPSFWIQSISGQPM